MVVIKSIVNYVLAHLWNTILQDCLPTDYNMVIFKANINNVLAEPLKKKKLYLVSTTVTNPHTKFV